MINLDTTLSTLQVVTGAAVANTVVHASHVDLTLATGAIVANADNTTISTAATTNVVPAPASGVTRNVKFLTVRNTNAATSNTITIQTTDGTNVVPLWFGILGPGMQVSINEFGQVTVFSAGGIQLGPLASGSLTNQSVTSVSAGFATDTYLAGSQILIPTQRPRIGTRLRVRFDMTKTAAGTATPIVTLRYGTLGTTGDAALCTFTFGAGTAAADTGIFEVNAVYRSVGTGTTAVLQGICDLTSNLATTGMSSTIKAVANTSAGHDSTTANTYLGLSFNGGTSFSGTNTTVVTELINI